MNNRYLLIYFAEYKYHDNQKFICKFATLYEALANVKNMKSEYDKRIIIIDLFENKTLLDVEYK